MEVLLEDVPLLDAGVDREGLRMADVTQRLLVGGGLAVDVHGKVGALHLAGRRVRAAAGVLGQVVQLVQRRCFTLQVLADAQEEVRVRGGDELQAVVAVR